MAQAASARGLTSTSPSPIIRSTQPSTHGLDAERLAKQLDEIDRLNDQSREVHGAEVVEVDILADGRLDLPDRS